jgi:hypothetical protein
VKPRLSLEITNTTKGILFKGSEKGRGFIVMRMVMNFKGSGKMMKNIPVFIPIVLGALSKANLSMARWLMGSCFIRTAKATKVSFLMERDMEVVSIAATEELLNTKGAGIKISLSPDLHILMNVLHQQRL